MKGGIKVKSIKVLNRICPLPSEPLEACSANYCSQEDLAFCSEAYDYCDWDYSACFGSSTSDYCSTDQDFCGRYHLDSCGIDQQGCCFIDLNDTCGYDTCGALDF